MFRSDGAGYGWGDGVPVELLAGSFGSCKTYNLCGRLDTFELLVGECVSKSTLLALLVRFGNARHWKNSLVTKWARGISSLRA